MSRKDKKRFMNVAPFEGFKLFPRPVSMMTRRDTSPAKITGQALCLSCSPRFAGGLGLFCIVMTILFKDQSANPVSVYLHPKIRIQCRFIHASESFESDYLGVRAEVSILSVCQIPIRVH